MKKMHICLVGVEYPPDTYFGGIATYQKRLADSLIALGHRVTVICGSGETDKEYFEDDIHVIRLYTSRDKETVESFNNYRTLVKQKILEIHKVDKIDIIETPEFSGEIIDFLGIHNIPVVVKLHTSYKIWAKLNKQNVNNKLSKEIIKAETLCLKYADKYISCSEKIKELINEYYPEINTKNMEVIPNPANTKDFYPTHYRHNSKTIIYCGSFENRKGIFILAKAIPIIFDEINDKELKIQIIGDYNNVEQNGNSPKEQFLKEIPKKYHKQIEFLGYIENKNLNEYFNKARIGVIPSLFDNLPYVAMEELLTELPIVASNNTGIKEMIINHDSGILYDPYDYKALAAGVINLYKNPELAKKYGKKGREEILRKYAPDVVAKQTIKIYETVIKNFLYKRLLRKVCQKYDIKILSKLKYGGANIVRKCLYNGNECILKIYDKNKNYNLELINLVLNKLNNVNKIIFKTKYLDYDIYLYSFIRGKHLKKYSQQQLYNLINSIEKIANIEVNYYHLTKPNIYDKYCKYRDYFKENSTTFNEKVINNLLKYDSIYGKNMSNTYIIHGDLSPANIIWQGNNPFLIDFDECTYAPLEYEYMSFLIKTSFSNNHFDILTALNILSIIKEKNFDIKLLKYNFYFYILKVLFEKLYFYETAGLDLNDPQQQKDFWKWWYDLLLNKDIEQALFKTSTPIK